MTSFFHFVLFLIIFLSKQISSVTYTGTSIGIYYNISIDDTTTRITLVTSYSDKWLGIGFGATKMENTYSIIYSATSGEIEERQLGNHNSGILLSECSPSATCSVLISDTTQNGQRTVIIIRDNIITDSLHQFYNYKNSIQLITARGSTGSLSAHQTKSNFVKSYDIDVVTSTTNTPQSSAVSFDEIINVNLSLSYNWNYAYNQSVTCSFGSNCYVNCIGEDQCRYLSIYGNYSHNLYLTCYGSDSCDGAKVYGPNTGNLIINCNNSNKTTSWYSNGACEWMDVYANNVNTMNITCDNEEDCKGIAFFVDNAINVNINFDANSAGKYAYIYGRNVSNQFNVICKGYEACYYSDIWCPYSSFNTKCDIDCAKDGSCAAMTIYIESSKYSNLELECDLMNKTHCFKGQWDYSWWNDNALLYCLDSDYSSELIYSKYDAALSCHAGCCPFEVLEIFCTDDDDDCVIDCTEIYCEGHQINATHKSSLKVICNDNDVNSTCNHLGIYCPINGICDIQCDQDEYRYTYEYMCDGIFIDGANSDSSDIYVKCNAVDSCSQMAINAPNVNSVTINATESYAMFYAQIHAENVNQFNMECKTLREDYWDYDACVALSLYIPSDDNSNNNINCFGLSCANLDFYVVNGIEAIAKDIKITSYCQCPEDPSDCINYWGIHCGDEYQYNSYYYGYQKECRTWWGENSTDDNCGCDNMTSLLYKNHVNVDDEYSNIDCCEYQYDSYWWWDWDESEEYDECNPDPNDGKNNESSISSGAITGIVMSVLAVIGLILFIWFLYDKKKKARHLQSLNSNPDHPQNSMISNAQFKEFGDDNDDNDGIGTTTR